MQPGITGKIIAAFALMLAPLSMQGEKTQEIAPPRAWTVSQPLGLRYESTLDTLHLNYHATAVPSLRSKAWATTGNYGAPGQNQIFFDRSEPSDFFIADALGSWLQTSKTKRFYNTRVPMTLLSYTTGGNKYSTQDRTTIEFSGNAGAKLEIGGDLDYIYSKGSYDNQSDKNFKFGLFGSYTGDRYELQTFFSHYAYTGLESGGIVDDRYITKPADVQGGVTKVDPKDIVTRLNGAQSKLNGAEFYMNHRYKVGYWRYNRDSVTDTIVSRQYVPVTSFIWTLDYTDTKHNFLNNTASEDTSFFANTYLSLAGTDESHRFTRLSNTVGVSMLEGFSRWAKFGLAVYATHAFRRYTMPIDSVSGTELPQGLTAVPAQFKHTYTHNAVWAGAQLTKQHGSVLTYEAQAELGIYNVSDIKIEGDVSTRFFLWRDTVGIRAYGYFKSLEQPLLYKTFLSNHYAWVNDFSNTKRMRLGGELTVPFTGSVINVGYETLKDYAYLGNDGCPVQTGTPIHVLSASLRQNFKFGPFCWDNDLTYQTTTHDEILSLPKFAVYSNAYFKFCVARVLHVQVGVDGNYYTSYYAPAYNPATMSFHNQRDVKCGNFAFFNLYANFKMKQARFFVMYSHANKGIFGGDNYFASPHYPLNPGRFQMGVSVNFAN